MSISLKKLSETYGLLVGAYRQQDRPVTAREVENYSGRRRQGPRLRELVRIGDVGEDTSTGVLRYVPVAGDGEREVPVGSKLLREVRGSLPRRRERVPEYRLDPVESVPEQLEESPSYMLDPGERGPQLEEGKYTLPYRAGPRLKE